VYKITTQKDSSCNSNPFKTVW